MSRGRRLSLLRLGGAVGATLVLLVTLFGLGMLTGVPSAFGAYQAPMAAHHPAHVTPTVSFVTSVDCTGAGCTTPAITAASVTTSIIVIGSAGNNSTLSLFDINDSQHRPFVGPGLDFGGQCHSGNENMTVGFLNYIGPGTITVNVKSNVTNPLITVIEVSGGPIIEDAAGEECYGPSTAHPGFTVTTPNATQVGYPAIVVFAVGNQHAPGNNCSGANGSVVLYNYVVSDHKFGTQCSGYQAETTAGSHPVDVPSLHSPFHPIDGYAVGFNHDNTYGTGGAWSLNFSHTSQSGFPPTAGFNFTAMANISITPNSLFTWGWGDGNYSHGNTSFEAVNQSHNYSVGGNYSVWLNVTNSHGFRNVSHSLLVGVPGPPPAPPHLLDWLWIVAIICSSVFVAGLVLTTGARRRR